MCDSSEASFSYLKKKKKKRKASPDDFWGPSHLRISVVLNLNKNELFVKITVWSFCGGNGINPAGQLPH